MALLTRNADRIYWAARYLERGEDVSRLVQSYGELIDDLPTEDDSVSRWGALLAVLGETHSGSTDDLESKTVEIDERYVVRRLVSDAKQEGSVAQCVKAARSNLRTTREVLPREAWRAVNDLSLFTRDEAVRADDRRFRDRVLTRVIDDSRRLDGILTSSMSRDDAWQIWRLGRYLERADMTTRVVGVRAAALMAHRESSLSYDEVHWMGVLRSLSALQMYQRSTRGSIDATSVVQFLLFDARFPRAVAFCLDEIDRSLDRLTRSDGVRATVTVARDALMSTMATTTDGADLDRAMEWVQSLLGKVNSAITDRYLSIDGG
ncbi:alpha-E domain-containing protein [Ilumatobacter nonamiensis]|uniref:alpha-E domain-containing protein n=1 Tax=Ilumatobacter nonamiensis TaxID=467093 RepID=UPI00034A9F73|nr:alpha-E domain-containing protein [Ilumatobacter nonamiensis]